MSYVCKRGKGGGNPHTGGDPDRLAVKLQLSRPPRLESGPCSGSPGSPSAPAPPAEPGGLRGRGTRTSRPRGGGGSGRARSLPAWPGRAGVGPRGVAPGLSPPAREPKPGPRESRWGRGSPRGQGKLRGRLPPAPGSPSGSARARGQAALTHGRRPGQCRPDALPSPCQQRRAPSPLRTMTVWVQLIHLEWGGGRCKADPARCAERDKPL